MKHRGSVRGRADAGTGSGPGMEQIITASLKTNPASEFQKKSRSGDIKFAEFDCPQLYKATPSAYLQK